MDALRNLAARYAGSFPAEAARRLETVDSKDIAAFIADLEPQTAVEVIDRMLPFKVAAAFEAMDRGALSAILGQLSVARCVVVMRSVERSRRATMLSLLPQGIAAKVERLVGSSEGSAGVLAEPVPAVLSPDMSVEEAQRVVDEISGPYVYVVDADQRLLGVMHREDLAKSNQRARVGSLMTRQVIRLPSAAPHSAVRSHRAWIDYDMLPVVDGSGVLVGVIRHRDIRRAGLAQPGTPVARRSALAAVLDLGEVYWSGLASVVIVMAGGHASDGSAEVKNGG